MNDISKLSDVVGHFDAGVFEDKAIDALKRVVIGILATGKKGQISLIIDMEQIGDSSNIAIKHTLKTVQPTRNGKAVEENTTSTPMYADNLGNLTLYPLSQGDMFAIPGSARVLHPEGVNRHG